MKVVVNRCCGGFELSEKAQEMYERLSGMEDVNYRDMSIEFRSSPALVQTVETLGEEANGEFANLCIEEASDEYDCFIDVCEGWEAVCYRVLESRMRELVAKGDADAVISYVNVAMERSCVA